VEKDPLVEVLKEYVLKYAKLKYPAATRLKIIVSVDMETKEGKVVSVTQYPG
jgi:hypothetical protein